MNYTEEEKIQYLNESKSFCMMPWVHLHVTPAGAALPCCIGNHSHTVGNITEKSLIELVNSDGMNDLRRDMLDGVLNPACSACHSHEEQGIVSFRKTNNEAYGKYFDEVLTHTDIDGILVNFKMRYFDIRLSNICNMKCRTCNSQYSSMWEQEDNKQGTKTFSITKDTRTSYLPQILQHIPHIDMAYFAGGEPFISEEHYIMLEEMIKHNRTDIVLRYNSNLSVLGYKNKDLLSLWKHFKNKVQIYASIDHYGSRAEYIRHGTDWGKIENNFDMLKKLDYVSMQINSVLSIYNFVTFGDFYNYIIDKNWIDSDSFVYTVYNMISPVYLTALALPNSYKILGTNNINTAINRLQNIGYTNNITPMQITQLSDAINWATSKNTWDEHKDLFRAEIVRLDTIRNENFTTVFPELSGLMHD